MDGSESLRGNPGTIYAVPGILVSCTLLLPTDYARNSTSSTLKINTPHRADFKSIFSTKGKAQTPSDAAMERCRDLAKATISEVCPFVWEKITYYIHPTGGGGLSCDHILRLYKLQLVALIAHDSKNVYRGGKSNPPKKTGCSH